MLVMVADSESLRKALHGEYFPGALELTHFSTTIDIRGGSLALNSSTLVLSVAVFVMLGLAIPFRGSDTAVDPCWPVGNITFTAGSKQEVTRGAVEFLIKVEDVPKHAYWPTGMSGVLA